MGWDASLLQGQKGLLESWENKLATKYGYVYIMKEVDKWERNVEWK